MVASQIKEQLVIEDENKVLDRIWAIGGKTRLVLW